MTRGFQLSLEHPIMQQQQHTLALGSLQSKQHRVCSVHLLPWAKYAVTGVHTRVERHFSTVGECFHSFLKLPCRYGGWKASGIRTLWTWAWISVHETHRRTILPLRFSHLQVLICCDFAVSVFLCPIWRERDRERERIWRGGRGGNGGLAG